MPSLPSGIGEFIIGASPIERQREVFDYLKTIVSQYANSPTLTQLIQNFNEYIDPAQHFDAFFDLIWNVDTAQGHGLDVWGRIVGVERTVQVPIPGSNFFGFQEAHDPLITGFNQAPFFGGSGLTQNFTMPDSAYRTVILAKAAANISDGSIRSMNAVLRTLFPGRGVCYVRDNLDMTLTYVFAFVLTPVELATVVQSGILPRPAGVSTNFLQV
jgi:hypothetical protein